MPQTQFTIRYDEDSGLVHIEKDGDEIGLGSVSDQFDLSDNIMVIRTMGHILSNEIKCISPWR